MEKLLGCVVAHVLGDLEVTISASTLGMGLQSSMLASKRMPIGANDTHETLGNTLVSEVREVIDIVKVCVLVGEHSDIWKRYSVM